MAIANDTEWHNRSAIDVLAQLNSSATGLTTQDAQQRIKVDGSNELQESRRVSLLWIFLGQFKSLIIWILIAAGVLSGALGDVVDAVAIFAIVLLNAAIGFYQEFRAEESIAALKKMTAPSAKVRRDGQLCSIPASDVVAGDKQFGIERPDQSLSFGRSSLVVQGRGDCSELPAGAVERTDFGPVRRLPRHDIAAFDSGGAEAVCERRFGTDHGRQRWNIPRSSRCAVLRRPWMSVGGADVHRISAGRTSTRVRSEWHHAAGWSR